MTANLHPESTSTSRRALLAGALGGLGALAASAIGRASPARAADGNIIHVGDELTATSVTKLTNTSNIAIVLEAESSTGIGVQGVSSSSVAVAGISTSHIGVHGGTSSGSWPGTRGWSDGNGTGVQGYSGPFPLPAAKANTGVYGYANQNSSAKGIYGKSPKGFAGFFLGKVYTSKFHEMREINTPGAPGANRARLFIRDNGSGKTQLCVRYATGAVQVLNTQP